MLIWPSISNLFFLWTNTFMLTCFSHYGCCTSISVFCHRWNLEVKAMNGDSNNISELLTFSSTCLRRQWEVFLPDDVWTFTMLPRPAAAAQVHCQHTPVTCNNTKHEPMTALSEALLLHNILWNTQGTYFNLIFEVYFDLLDRPMPNLLNSVDIKI